MTWNATNDPKSHETSTLTYSVKNLGKFSDVCAALNCMSTYLSARFQIKLDVHSVKNVIHGTFSSDSTCFLREGINQEQNLVLLNSGM